MNKPNHELLKYAQLTAYFSILFRDELRWKLAQEALKEAYGYEDKEVPDVQLH